MQSRSNARLKTKKDAKCTMMLSCNVRVQAISRSRVNMYLSKIAVSVSLKRIHAIELTINISRSVVSLAASQSWLTDHICPEQ